MSHKNVTVSPTPGFRNGPSSTLPRTSEPDYGGGHGGNRKGDGRESQERGIGRGCSVEITNGIAGGIGFDIIFMCPMKKECTSIHVAVITHL